MVRKTKIDTSTENVYLKHISQDSWNETQAYHIENESVWRNIAILAIIALAVVSVYAMYCVNQDKHKTLIFEKDSLGNITTLGLATKTFNVDNKVVAHQLANFIRNLREIPLDINVKRRNIDMVHKMIDPKIREQVDRMIIAQYAKTHDGLILVEINNIKPLEGGVSWQVNWEERVMENGATTSGVTTWSSVIAFKRLDSLEPNVQLINPIGLFITYLHPTEDINKNK
jgi:type IV secretory pathway TrbF-like protein